MMMMMWIILHFTVTWSQTKVSTPGRPLSPFLLFLLLCHWSLYTANLQYIHACKCVYTPCVPVTTPHKLSNHCNMLEWRKKQVQLWFAVWLLTGHSIVHLIRFSRAVVSIMERSPFQHALCGKGEAHVIYLHSHCWGINQAASLQATLSRCVTSTVLCVTKHKTLCPKNWSDLTTNISFTRLG